jgi:hypothetical protein
MDSSGYNPLNEVRRFRIASVFGVEESELRRFNRLKAAERERRTFIDNALTDKARQKLETGEATLDEILLFGDGDV